MESGPVSGSGFSMGESVLLRREHMQGNRRQFLQAAATGAAVLSCPPLLGQSKPKNRATVDTGKLLIIVAAAGGASIVDSFLPVIASSDNSGIRSYRPEQIESIEGSAFRAVKK